MSTQIVENVSGQMPPPIQPIDSFQAELEKYVGHVVADFTKNLLKDYEIFQPKDVAKYVAENLFLIDLLKETPSQIKKHFGSEQKLILQFFLDPEDPSGHGLHILVLTKSSVEEARSLMDKFDEDWWFDNEHRSHSKIMVNLRYIK